MVERLHVSNYARNPTQNIYLFIPNSNEHSGFNPQSQAGRHAYWTRVKEQKCSENGEAHTVDPTDPSLDNHSDGNMRVQVHSRGDPALPTHL